MKISLLKQRENFQEILKNTLEKYFFSSGEISCQVSAHSHDNSTRFIVNDLLNVIYPYRMNRKELSVLVKEFTWNRNVFLMVAQKIYCYLSVRAPFERIIGDDLYISNSIQDLSNLVIIPGNHSVRIVNVVNDTCVVICKSGFNERFLLKDASVRMENPDMGAPKVFKIEASEGYYVEERVIGVPLNRISCINVRNKHFYASCKDLRTLYNRSLVKVKSDDYIDLIKSKLDTLLLQFNGSFQDRISKLISCLLSKLEEELDGENIDSILLCTTHGDFQSANILCSNDKQWIIDWEYSNKRMLFYDALTFALDSRTNNGLSSRLTQAVLSTSSFESKLSWVKHSYHPCFINFFIFEDILLRLDEVSSNLIKDSESTLDPYVKELESFYGVYGDE